MLVTDDREKRIKFLAERTQLSKEEEYLRVLFVVPTEPLVWQVAAYFTKLLVDIGETETKVAIVTDQLTFSPYKRFGVMPQIVVGTPAALESALCKPRGITGVHETQNKAQGNILPGGFDHFDWVIYDEVHSLDGLEGDALQRLIRSMNCRFLALSATVGNAEELRGWMERVRGDQISEVESVDVVDSICRNSEVALENAATEAKKIQGIVEASTDSQQQKLACRLRIKQTLTGVTVDVSLTESMLETYTVHDLKQKVFLIWPYTDLERIKHGRYPVQLTLDGQDLKEDKNYCQTMVFRRRPQDQSSFI